MKTNNGEVITNQASAEALTEIRQQAEVNVAQIEQQTDQAEQEAMDLEMELFEAQMIHERQEEAERQVKETGEKIGELSG